MRNSPKVYDYLKRKAIEIISYEASRRGIELPQSIVEELAEAVATRPAVYIPERLTRALAKAVEYAWRTGGPSALEKLAAVVDALARSMPAVYLAAQAAAEELSRELAGAERLVAVPLESLEGGGLPPVAKQVREKQGPSGYPRYELYGEAAPPTELLLYYVLAHAGERERVEEPSGAWVILGRGSARLVYAGPENRPVMEAFTPEELMERVRVGASRYPGIPAEPEAFRRMTEAFKRIEWLLEKSKSYA